MLWNTPCRPNCYHFPIMCLHLRMTVECGLRKFASNFIYYVDACLENLCACCFPEEFYYHMQFFGNYSGSGRNTTASGRRKMSWTTPMSPAMIGENRQLLTDEPVEFDR